MASELLHHHVTQQILASFFEVHRVLGFGFLETVYARALELEMRSRGLEVEREAVVEVFYKGRRVGYFRADALVERCVVLEIKSCPRIDASDEQQLLNCIRCSTLEVGLLLNFGRRATFRRFVASNHDGVIDVELEPQAAPTNGKSGPSL